MSPLKNSILRIKDFFKSWKCFFKKIFLKITERICFFIQPVPPTRWWIVNKKNFSSGSFSSSPVMESSSEVQSHCWKSVKANYHSPQIYCSSAYHQHIYYEKFKKTSEVCCTQWGKRQTDDYSVSILCSQIKNMASEKGMYGNSRQTTPLSSSGCGCPHPQEPNQKLLHHHFRVKREANSWVCNPLTFQTSDKHKLTKPVTQTSCASASMRKQPLLLGSPPQQSLSSLAWHHPHKFQSPTTGLRLTKGT